MEELVMNYLEEIKQAAKKMQKTIILPESMDERILDAAEIIIAEKIANIILIGEKETIIQKHPKLTNTKIINPITYEDTPKLINELYELRKHKGMTLEKAKNLILNDYMYFACMLIKNNEADGIVSGACHSTANTLRPALQIIKAKPNTPLVSSFFIMEIPNCDYKKDGLYLFADCGLEQNPDPTKLAHIAISSAESYQNLLHQEPYVALLSHSTKKSAQHPDTEKVIEAYNIAKNLRPNLKIDGELQLDAAIIPEVAKLKAPNSSVAGHANVLIFPDLDAGNIGYKLVQRFAHANAYGPITQGMNNPVNDLSRGCTIDDIIGTIALTIIQTKKD